MTIEQLESQVLKLSRVAISLQEQINELKKQLPMTITEAPFEADEDKVASDYSKPKVEYTVDGAPVWNVWFNVFTSEGLTERNLEQQAWTEKQAIFLARTEQLFPMMNLLVKQKQIEPKWSIVDSVADKK